MNSFVEKLFFLLYNLYDKVIVMEYSRAVATGLNYLETQYGIEVNALVIAFPSPF